MRIPHSIMYLAGWLVVIDGAHELWGESASWFAWGCGMALYAFLLELGEDKK